MSSGQVGSTASRPCSRGWTNDPLGRGGARTPRRTLTVTLSLVFSAAAWAAAAAEPTPLDIRGIAGDWACVGRFLRNNAPIAAHVRIEAVEDAGAALVRHDDDPPNHYHAIELWGAEPSGGYQATIVDRSGGIRTLTSSGWSGLSLAWTRVSTGQGERFTYTRLPESRLRVDWEVSRDGGPYRLGDTVECLRG